MTWDFKCHCHIAVSIQDIKDESNLEYKIFYSD